MINDGLIPLAEQMRETERAAVRAGCPAAIAASILLRAEAALVNAANAACRVEHQFQLDLKEHGREAMAQRFGVTPRTISTWKAEGFNKKRNLRCA
jgi:hypothetical protein